MATKKAATKKAPAKKASGKAVTTTDHIKAAYKVFSAELAAGNAAGVGKLYTTNGRLLPPNAELVKGIKAITAFWQGAIDMGVRGAKLKPVEVEQFGTTAVEVGVYSLATASGAPIDQGKYIVVWKKDAGQWKLHRDIYNSSKSAG